MAVFGIIAKCLKATESSIQIYRVLLWTLSYPETKGRLRHIWIAALNNMSVESLPPTA